MSGNPIHPNYERHADDWHEWSTDTSERRDDGTLLGKPQRIFVRVGDCGGLIQLIEAKVTSDKPEGRQLEGRTETELLLTDDMAAWLVDVLTKARAANAESAEDDATAEPEHQ